MGCRYALLSEPTATHWLHHISPRWLTYYEGDLHKWQRNPADTLSMSFEKTLSTSLFSQGEVPACKGRGNPPAVGSCTPGGCVRFQFVHWHLFIDSCFYPAPLLHVILMRFQQPHQSVAEVLLLSTFHSLQGGAWFTTLALVMKMELTTVHCLCK